MHVRQGQKIAVLRLELELNKGDVCWLVVPMARDGAADGGNYRDEAEDGVEHGQPRWVSRSSTDRARSGRSMRRRRRARCGGSPLSPIGASHVVKL